MLLLLALGMIGWYFYDRSQQPSPAAVNQQRLHFINDPVQVMLPKPQFARITNRQGTFYLKLLAQYRLCGKIATAERYYLGWDGALSPLDLGICWGIIPLPENYSTLNFSTGHRFCYFRLKPDSPLDPTYVISHMSNNHLIPARDNLRKALLSLKEGQLVLLEGYLVEVSGFFKERPVNWGTSLTRDDSGNHACELFYVTRVTTEDAIYL